MPSRLYGAMLCETCRDRGGPMGPGWIMELGADENGRRTVTYRPCQECIGGTANCCGDAITQAGNPEPCGEKAHD